MLTTLKNHSARLLPRGPLGHLGWLRGAVGAGLGVGLAALVSVVLVGGLGENLPLLVASMGASAVLLFGLPASPLAQPWPVIGGNLISALAGLVTGMAVGAPIPAAALAVVLAIAAMSMLRCLHPPGGGTALVYALGAAGAEHWTLLWLVPCAVNVLALAVAGWLFNNLTGHAWPHRLVVPPAPAASSDQATREDVAAVLEDWGEVLDVDVDDVLALVQAVDRQRARSQRR